jgi:recombinational DNA repair protein RecR
MNNVQLNSDTFKNKNGQTIHCDRSNMAYHGLRHQLHRIDATESNNITISLIAYRQVGVGWRILCVEQNHNEQQTTANFIGEQYKRLDEILSNAQSIVSDTGYLM